MNERSALYLKVLLNRFHKGPIENFIKNLELEDQAQLQKSPIMEKNIEAALINPEELLEKIHYSWLAEWIQTLPEKKRLLYLGALKESLHIPARKLLGHNHAPSLKNPIVKKHLQKEIVTQILPPDYLSLSYLPKNDLLPLVHLTKSELVDVIVYLGLYDLASEIRKTVNPKIIKNIYLVLKPRKQQYLKSILNKKSLLHFTRFDLSDWDGTPKELEFRLHKRGLSRLSHALAGEEPQFLWHLTRKLDTGRGRLIEQMVNKETSDQVSQIMKNQTLNIIKFVKGTV